MSSVNPINTAYGILNGRDSIFLDEVSMSNRTNHLHLKGEFNGSLLSIPAEEKWIPYELTFEWVLASKITELDTWESQQNWYNESSFDEVIDSEWLKSLSRNRKLEHKHFIILTYDDVIEVICKSFNLVLSKPHA